MSHRRYQRHTAQCSGSDWAVVELVINAGTIEILPPDAVICDCDRAAIILKCESGIAARNILKINNVNFNRLTDLGHQLWPTLTSS